MLVPGNPARFWAGVLCALAVPPRTVKHTTIPQVANTRSDLRTQVTLGVGVCRRSCPFRAGSLCALVVLSRTVEHTTTKIASEPAGRSA